MTQNWRKMAPRVAALFVCSVCFLYLVSKSLELVHVNVYSSSVSCKRFSDYFICLELRVDSTIIGTNTKRQRLSAPILYYVNGSACFRTNLRPLTSVQHPQITLMRCGDIHANPGPVFNSLQHDGTASFDHYYPHHSEKPCLNSSNFVASSGLVRHVWHPSLLLPTAGQLQYLVWLPGLAWVVTTGSIAHAHPAIPVLGDGPTAAAVPAWPATVTGLSTTTRTSITVCSSSHSSARGSAVQGSRSAVYIVNNNNSVQ